MAASSGVGTVMNCRFVKHDQMRLAGLGRCIWGLVEGLASAVSGRGLGRRVPAKLMQLLNELSKPRRMHFEK